MFLHHPSFTNRPEADATFLPNNFNLNSLRTSGWYAPIGVLQNAPDNFALYQLFVVAPNPDIYATQLAFGVSYKIISVAEDDGDTTIVDGEVLEDVHGNAVYTNKRLAADFDDDGTIDTKLDSLYVDVNKEKFNILRLVTNGKVNYDHVSANDYDDETIQANEIVEDTPDIVITNRSAIFVRSYINGSWTPWITFGNASSTVTPESTGDPTQVISTVDSDKIAANFEKLYAYIDSRITFLSSIPGVELYGLQVEVTGSYNEAPYDPSYNVYGVQASGIEYNGLGDFPETGDPQKLYIAKDENRLYRWDEISSSYRCCGSDYNEIISISSDMGALPQTIPNQEDNNDKEEQTEP